MNQLDKDFTRIPNAFIRTQRHLSDKAVKVMNYICSCINSNDAKNGDEKAFPALDTIAENVGFSQPTVSRMIIELEAFALIVKERQFNNSNHYRLGTGLTTDEELNEVVHRMTKLKKKSMDRIRKFDAHRTTNKGTPYDESTPTVTLLTNNTNITRLNNKTNLSDKNSKKINTVSQEERTSSLDTPPSAELESTDSFKIDTTTKIIIYDVNELEGLDSNIDRCKLIIKNPYLDYIPSDKEILEFRESNRLEYARFLKDKKADVARIEPTTPIEHSWLFGELNQVFGG